MSHLKFATLLPCLNNRTGQLRVCIRVLAARRGGALAIIIWVCAIRKRASCHFSAARSANFNIEQRTALSLGVSSQRRTIHMHMNSLSRQTARSSISNSYRVAMQIFISARRVISGRPRCIAISAKCTWPNHFSYSAPIVRLPSIKKHVMHSGSGRRQICQRLQTFIGPNLSNILSAGNS
jgi:hypothetical protein